MIGYPMVGTNDLERSLAILQPASKDVRLGNRLSPQMTSAGRPPRRIVSSARLLH